ncbi:T9SS type A sorting domain-containing protein [Hymenobacter sp. 15J16-1T3B]|uniref:LamG-like jellyroll fold domain-containing protein n=1 Tax=Hymenobacter sp. 15J16-1T3B TaxID=2886941 RepID=UPI001D123F10|nr:LamG-like jellyroll fold domain-containing protein [Hymenobacter sp. 15J16-1T3B]MCC3159611.1 T9SS type A sorting domain-containing protein [Hymenobacter sp. 15J16-1T3B]
MQHVYSSLVATSFAGTTRRAVTGALLAGLLGLSLGAAAQTPAALTLNGSSTYVQANSITLNGPLTIEAWVKVTAFKTTSPFISSVAGVEDGNNAAMLRFGDAGIAANKLQFVLTIGTAQQKVTSVATFNTNTWYHIAGTYDGTNMRIYVNGVLDNTLNAPSSATLPVAGTGVFYLGRNYENLRVLNGALDEVRVWTRALSAAELLASPCSVSATATGLEANWKLNEGSGATAADATSHAHTGTLVGTTTTMWSTTVPASCATTAARPAADASGLQVQVLGNPASGSQAELEIRGAQAQPTVVEVLNTLGAVVSRQQLKPTAEAQRSSLNLPTAAGLYVVRVSTPAGSASAKLLKQ